MADLGSQAPPCRTPKELAAHGRKPVSAMDVMKEQRQLPYDPLRGAYPLPAR